MAVAIQDGVLGLEARHTWQDLDGNELTMNLRDGTYPDLRLKRIPGLHSRAERDDNRMPKVGRMGEQPYPGSTRGKTVVYEGAILGRTLQELRSGAAEARAVFSDIGDRGFDLPMTVEPHPTYGTIAHFYKASVMQYDSDDDQIYGPTRMPTPYQRDFILGLRQSDPRYWVTVAESEPLAAAAEETITNLGRAPTDPKFTVDGPITDGAWTIERRNPDVTRALVLEGITIGGGESLSIVFGEPWDLGLRQVVKDDGTDLSGLINWDESDWWNERVNPLYPGDNDVYSSRACTVEWYHANW